MIEFLDKKDIVAKGLKEYLKYPVIRSNQNAEPPPYPYVPYTITTLSSENKGTYGEYEDDKARKPVVTVMSVSVVSDDYNESVRLANEARSWFDYVGKNYLKSNDVIVQSVTSVTNRDNLLTVDYEYKNGFDVFFWGFDVVEIPDVGEITEVDLNYLEPVKKQDYEQIIKDLNTQIDRANAEIVNLNTELDKAEADISSLETEKSELAEILTDTETALDNIIARENSYIGGDSV